jgi:hypothetical protein
MASGLKESAVQDDVRRAKSRRRRPPTRGEGTLEIMDRLLARRVSISLSGQAKQVTASEAIVLQLMQKTMAGNARACRALLKYQEFASSRSNKSAELRFVESDYTRAVANSFSRSDGG